jgi:hypothetical protein
MMTDAEQLPTSFLALVAVLAWSTSACLGSEAAAAL